MTGKFPIYTWFFSQTTEQAANGASSSSGSDTATASSETPAEVCDLTLRKIAN